MQNVFPTPSGAGTRCYYSPSGALIFGEKEQYLPTPWAYFNYWDYLADPKTYIKYFWNTVLPAQRMKYKAMEIDPYNACCKYSGSANLCGLYREKRPLDSCAQYVPPQTGFLFGDPHINTLDGVPYTFNGLGEFTLANIKDENHNIVFRLQGRTAIAGNGNGTSNATYFVGLAAYTTSGDQVQWTLLNDNATRLSYNGTIIPLTDNVTYVDHVAFERTASGEVKASFNNGISISVTATLGILNFVLTLSSVHHNRTEGLLGLYNGNPNDDFMFANGNTLPYNGTLNLKESELFTYGMTWKTTPENSIFTYDKTNNESWYTYNNNTFVPSFFDELLSTSDSETLQKANETCEGNMNCLFDILSTKNFGLGMVTMKTDLAFTNQRIVMETFPPNISGYSTIMTSLNVKILMDYTVSSGQLFLETTSSDLVMSENGTLTWLPTSSAPVFAVIKANNSVAAVELGLTLILCNCSNDGICDFNNAVPRNEQRNSRFMTAACKCSDSWTGEFCTEDFDACLENNCFITSSCMDNPAPLDGYKCSPCPKGLIGDGIKCFDIDECYQNSSDCEQICINTIKGYNCSCTTGYRPDKLNSFQCEDINECIESAPCAEHTVCYNSPGNYSCTCMGGYNGDPYLLCTDINECTTGFSNLCSNTSVCINTNGSYYCECLSGYNGVNCSDIVPTHVAPQPSAVILNTLTTEHASKPKETTFHPTTLDTKESTTRQLTKTIYPAVNLTSTVDIIGTEISSIFLTAHQNVSVSTCLRVSCPEAYCSNSGICSINTTTCSPVCKCHPMFTDEKCNLAGNNFTAKSFKVIPNRSVTINIWIKGEDDSSLSNTSSEKYIQLQQTVNKTASLYLQSLLAFDKNSKVLLQGVDGKAQTQITSEFMYSNNRTIISFLNEILISSIVHEFNMLKSGTRRRREIRVVSFEKMFIENITNIELLNVSELEPYFTCDILGFTGYIMEYSNNGFVCVSPCTKSYCQNNATCEHLDTGPTCRCVPYLIYSPYGNRCEDLALNFKAFLGILFGSLGMLTVVLAIAILTTYCCRKRKSSADRNPTDYWGPTPIDTFNKLQETALASKPELKRWTPHLEKVPVAPQIKIQRPTLQDNFLYTNEYEG